MSGVQLPGMSSLSQDIINLTSEAPTSSREKKDDDPEDFAHLELATHLKGMSINAFDNRFFGRSRYVGVF